MCRLKRHSSQTNFHRSPLTGSSNNLQRREENVTEVFPDDPSILPQFHAALYNTPSSEILTAESDLSEAIESEIGAAGVDKMRMVDGRNKIGTIKKETIASRKRRVSYRVITIILTY